MIKKLLKEVGRGKRGARDLDYNEAMMMANAIVNKEATPAQIGAFFVAERVKMESIEELQAFVTVLRKRAHRVMVPNGIDCTGPNDGRKKTFYATFPTAFLLAAAGLPVTLHGTESLPPKYGVTLHNILGKLGIDVAGLTREQIINAGKETGVMYIPTEQWCPPLKELRNIRIELDMRTILNTAEKLIDFSHSPYLIFGVFHNTVFERMAKLSEHLGYKKALIVQGPEGSEDLFIDRPTRTYFVENGSSNLRVIDPDTYGLETALPEVDWTDRNQQLIAEEVLQGKAHLAYVNQVILNAAVRLHLAERVDSIEEGLYISKSILDSGVPWRLYQKWCSMLQASKIVNR